MTETNVTGGSGQECPLQPAPVPVERSGGGFGTSGQAGAQNGAEGREGWVYAIRTAPFGNVLYEADSPEACIALSESSQMSAGYLPEFDEIVGRPKPIKPEPWTVIVPVHATGVSS